jgi:hypothetical protein
MDRSGPTGPPDLDTSRESAARPIFPWWVAVTALGFGTSMLTIVVLWALIAGLTGHGSTMSWVAVAVITPLTALYDYRLFFLVVERSLYPNLRHWIPTWIVTAVHHRTHR